MATLRLRREGRAIPTILAALTLGAALALAGCGGSEGAAVPQAWIDAPLHESTHPVAPLEIVLHAADPGGIALVEVAVNGTVLSRRPPDDSRSSLAVSRVAWDPQQAGSYVLSAKAKNQAGTWSAETSAVVTLVTGEPAARPSPQPAPTRTAPPAQSAPTRSAPTPTPPPACTDVAGFIADVTIPDDTRIDPGAAFTKVWRLRNDGTCVWTESYQVVFVGGEPMGNSTPVSLPTSVAPGATVDLSLPLVAPFPSGTYRSSYQLRNAQGARFGVGASGLTPFYAQIVVGEARPTPTTPSRSAPDTRPPAVTVAHTPAGDSLPTGSSITFVANASDNVGVTRIDLWVTAPGGAPTLVKTCTNTASCSFTGGPYGTRGNLSYYAVAADAAGNETTSSAHTVVVYIVVSRVIGRGAGPG